MLEKKKKSKCQNDMKLQVCSNQKLHRMKNPNTRLNKKQNLTKSHVPLKISSAYTPNQKSKTFMKIQ